MVQNKHDELPELTAEARATLPRAEFKRAVREGAEAGEQASSSESYRWVLVVAIGAAVVTAIVYDWRALIPAALLMLFYTIPFIVAARSTAGEVAEAEVLSDRVDHPHGSHPQGSPANSPQAGHVESADQVPPRARG